ncbi:transmembrane protein 209-like [Chlamydotis macqueenii]
MTPEQGAVTSRINRAIQRRMAGEAWEVVFAWSLINLSVEGLIFTGITGNLISWYCNITHSSPWYLEFALGCLFSLNAVCNFWNYFVYRVAPPRLVLTPWQWILLWLQNAGRIISPEQGPAISCIDRAIQRRKEMASRKVVWAWGVVSLGVAGMIFMGMYVNCYI